MPAAFIALIANTCLRSNLASHPSPAALLTAMNHCLYGWVETEHFVSMFIAVIDLPTRRMTFARAGHPRPLLMQADGRISELDADGIMLGVDAEPEFVEQSLQLQPGTECCFTRTACRNAGMPRTRCLKCNGCAGSSWNINNCPDRTSLSRSCRMPPSFSGNRDFRDDLTLVLLDATDDSAPARSSPDDSRSDTRGPLDSKDCSAGSAFSLGPKIG